MSLMSDIATMRVRRVPRGLRGPKGRKNQLKGTGHTDEDIHQHLTNAMNGRNTDETRGHVFRALNAVNKRRRAEHKAKAEQARPASAAGDPNAPVQRAEDTANDNEPFADKRD